MDDEAKEVVAVPADLSKSALAGWVSCIRLKALGYDAGSGERRQFLEQAGKNLRYAAWLLRASKARAPYLQAEAGKLPHLLHTEAG
jgi:hypothetical protein